MVTSLAADAFPGMYPDAGSLSVAATPLLDAGEDWDWIVSNGEVVGGT